MANLNIRNIDEGLKAEVKAAAAMAQMTLGEFCTMIFRSMKFGEVGKKIGVYKGVVAENKKNSGIPATGVGGAEFRGSSMGSMLGEAERIAGERVPGPGFGGVPEITRSSGNVFADLGLPNADLLDQQVRDAVVVGVPKGLELPADWGKLPDTPPVAIFGELTENDMAGFSDGDFPKVPDEAVAFARTMAEAAKSMAGADAFKPGDLEAMKGARTLQGVEAVDAHRKAKSKSGDIPAAPVDADNLKVLAQKGAGMGTVAKSKKIGKVPPPGVPTPGKSQEKKNVQTQSRQPQAGQSRQQNPQTENQSPAPQRQSPTAPSTSGGLDHDPNTCRMYGCLMCKLAKGEK